MTTAQVCMAVLRVDWEVNRRTIPAYRATLLFVFMINYEMQGLELVTPLQEVFAGAGDI